MTIDITLPSIEWWHWASLAAVIWYPLAGLVLKKLCGPPDDECIPIAIVVWLISPVLAVGLGAYLGLWTFASFASCGLFRPPWRSPPKKSKE